MLTHLSEAEVPPSRVVILGGSGFLGKCLQARLDSDGVETLVLSSRVLDLEAPGAAMNLVSLLRDDDHVVMAAALLPRKGRDARTMLRNLEMAVNVCEALESRPVEQVVYFSSDAVFPMSSEPISESSCAAPVDLYGVMHRSREVLFQRVQARAVCILRPTMVFGRGDPHNAYGPNRFCRTAAREGVISVFGNGEEMRDYVYCEDVAQITAEVLLRRSTGQVNVATGTSLSFKTVAEMVQSVFGDVDISRLPRENVITNRHFDVTNFRNSFPEFRFTSLQDAIASTYACYMQG